MTYFILLCLANAVFSSIPPVNESLETFSHSIKRSVDQKENKKENILPKLEDFDHSYYQDQIRDGFRKRNSERRIFDWINNIITNDSEKTVERAKEQKTEDAADVTKNFREIERNLTVTLTKLSHVLTQILNIVKYTRHGNFKSLNNLIKSSIYNKNRYKRDLNETIVDEKENLNKTKEHVEKGKDVQENKELEKDGRRTMQGSPFVSNEVKERLLHYINEGFDEIKSKIESLRQLKIMFSNNVNFKIGYIIANLDSLDANMRKLNEHLDVNERSLNDTKILSLYDTVKSSTTAVRNLMDVLKKYVNTNVN